MENAIKIFENEEFGNIRVAMSEDNEPLFCLADVAKALGYSNPAKAVIDHCKGVTVLETPTENQHGATVMQKMKYGKEGEVYRLAMKSKLPDAEKFQDWVCGEVLPTIRKTGGYSVKGRAVLSLSDRLLWVKGVSDILHLNDASTLDLLEKTAAPLGLPVPDYVPASDTVHSATEQLARRNALMKVAEFNRLMTEAGLMKRESRFSKSKGKEVTWPVLVGEGLRYGCNQVSPKNPRETQPEYYDGKFDELLKRLKN